MSISLIQVAGSYLRLIMRGARNVFGVATSAERVDFLYGV